VPGTLGLLPGRTSGEGKEQMMRSLGVTALLGVVLVTVPPLRASGARGFAGGDGDRGRQAERGGEKREGPAQRRAYGDHHDRDHDGDDGHDRGHCRRLVTGTASLGAPIVGAFVTLKDVAGNVRRARTDANGNYALNTSGLTPPFFLRVVTTAPSGNFPAGAALYSVSADPLSATTINTHVLTDLIVRTWFSAQGVNAGVAFSDPTGGPPSPSARIKLTSRASNAYGSLHRRQAHRDQGG
jgi:hypothetical protein